MDKRTVSLRILSRIDDGQEIAQTVQAEWKSIRSDIYLRYEEPPETMGNTRTTVKWSPASPSGAGALRVVRHGDMESEQTFRAGERLPGRYKTPYGQMLLETDTSQLQSSLADGQGRLSWSYELYVDGERTGEYRLTLEVES